MRQTLAAITIACLTACTDTPERKVDVVDDTGTRLTVTLKADPADKYGSAFAAYQALSQRWLDAYSLAGSTPRIALPPVISDMQGIRREMAALPLPPCLSRAKPFRLAAMDRQLAGMTSFLAMDSADSGNLERASTLVESATAIAKACNPKI